MFGLTGPDSIPNAIPNTGRQPAMPGMMCPDPAGWYAQDMAKLSHQWIYEFSDRQIGELMDRVADLERDGVDIKDINREGFPLPNTGPALEEIGRAHV